MENGELLEQLFGEVIQIKEKLNNFIENHDKNDQSKSFICSGNLGKQDEKNKDFEKRLRFIERGIWIFFGAFIIIEILVGK
ncbi:MAG: hypothetical protein KDC90_02225 [Ignavibacteriae bacterium]|nr:hypothetical protein [Ignavibacteriota bacterium]